LVNWETSHLILGHWLFLKHSSNLGRREYYVWYFFHYSLVTWRLLLSESTNYFWEGIWIRYLYLSEIEDLDTTPPLVVHPAIHMSLASLHSAHQCHFNRMDKHIIVTSRQSDRGRPISDFYVISQGWADREQMTHHDTFCHQHPRTTCNHHFSPLVISGYGG
jgi:hypothetical protein